jgi:hypothetical protein
LDNLSELISEYRRQMQIGAVPHAYRAIMDYMLELRGHLARNHPDYITSGNLYFGYMDMTYFAFVSPALARLKLKPAVVFIHASTSFEIWLAAANKQIQTQYWNLFRQKGFTRYPVLNDLRGEDAIIIHQLAAEPDFCDLPALSTQIERETLRFIQDIEQFFAENQIS